MAKKMTHLRFHNLENDIRWTDKLTPRAVTFEKLALRHIRSIEYYVQPGAHGIDGPQLAVTAVYADRTEADLTVDFVRAGWRRWLLGDEYEYLDAVPLTHVSRRRRIEAHCAQGDEPTAEQEAELAAARLAEAADMDREEARTRPGAQPVAATAPDAPATAVMPADAVEPEASVGIDTVAKAKAFMLENMLAAVASMPQPERRPSPTASPAAAEPDLSPEVVEAVHECLRVLSGAGDLGGDTAFVAAQAAKAALLPAGARTCRKLLARHRELLPPDLAALAMGEVAPEPVAAALLDPVAAPAEPAPKRGRGRPAKGATAMTAAERNRAWRASKGVVALEVPGALADRLRAARDARGGSMAALLEAALEVLEHEGSFLQAA